MTDAQYSDLMAVLREIRDTLRQALIPPDAPAVCAHPEGRRVDFSTLTVIEWRCKDCGYHHQAARSTGAPTPV